MKIKILIPIYNDWQSVFNLLDEINIKINQSDYEISIIIINDASSQKKPNNFLLGLFTKIIYNKGITNHRLPNRHLHHHQNLNTPPR